MLFRALLKVEKLPKTGHFMSMLLKFNAVDKADENIYLFRCFLTTIMLKIMKC